MFKSRFIIALFALLACSVYASVDVDEALQLEPSMDQRRASAIATRFLTNYHYKPTRLDDDLSSEIFDTYLDLLDPNRIYFLQSDIDALERNRFLMDDSLRHHDLMSAYDIFNLYRDRVRDRVAFSRERAQQPFDFTVDESYQFDREMLRLLCGVRLQYVTPGILQQIVAAILVFKVLASGIGICWKIILHLS